MDSESGVDGYRGLGSASGTGTESGLRSGSDVDSIDQSPRHGSRRAAPVRFVAFVVLAGVLLTSGGATGLAVPAATDGTNNRGPGGRSVAGEGDTVPAARDQPEALAALRRATRAEWTTAYAGTKFIAVWTEAAGRTATGSMSELVDVTNIPGRGTVVRIHRDSVGGKRGAPDRGHPADDRGADAALVAPGRPGSAEPASTATPAGRSPAPTGSATPGIEPSPAPAAVDAQAVSVVALARAYSVQLAGAATAAHREATVVAARRHDGSMAAKFWIDEATGLLLRREVFTRHGVITRASGFVTARIGARVTRSGLPPALASEPADVVPPRSYAVLADRGWDCCDRRLPGGFGLYDVRTTDAGATLHLSYSDGLSGASVFQQRGRLDGSALDGFAEIRVDRAKIYVRYGLSSYAVWAHDDLVYTAVCDTPDAVDAVVGAFPHSDPTRDGTGLAQRLDRGMSRMVSWLNPFE
ncbi:sigma-E factor regulatory protein RseB domain-containing protein [Actinopolymorpha sp. B11F2]|uniref:sigma-E factor regulatory protein RseB domain-containing protein n=1 Tax=Actinopolymorpha sp. B11F2 TaxID=3160862 RepID=UPI0032E44944